MSSSSVKWMGIVATLAVLLFIGVIALQALELMYYRAEPSLWLP